MDKSTEEALKKDLRKYEEKIKAIKTLLDFSSEDSNELNNNETLISQKNNHQSHSDEYLKIKTLKGKVLFFLKQNQRFLHCREIANMIIEQEPNLKISTRRVSQVISNLKKNEDSNLTRITVGSQLRNTFWGSENWLDKHGNPKPEHMYNQDYVYKEEKEVIVL